MSKRALQAFAPGSVGVIKKLRYIALHAAAAATFIFLLQRYALGATLEAGLLWALALGACAVALAYSQSNR